MKIIRNFGNVCETFFLQSHRIGFRYNSSTKVFELVRCIGMTNKTKNMTNQVRRLGIGPTSKDFEQMSPQAGPLTKHHAQQLVLRLDGDERQVLVTALQEFESKRLREEFEVQLAANRWTSKLGRPSKVPSLGDVDPTGTYCQVPEDWLKKKYAATVPPPSSRDVFKLALVNSVPFIGFGFLDNFIMIIAGDSIESSMGVYITLSTMAAAALGNTFSDIISIGSATYVERGVGMLGLQAPKMSPIQLDMPRCRNAANFGRVIGITLGCFLGMIPLLFTSESEKEGNKEVKKKT